MTDPDLDAVQRTLAAVRRERAALDAARAALDEERAALAAEKAAWAAERRQWEATARQPRQSNPAGAGPRRTSPVASSSRLAATAPPRWQEQDGGAFTCAVGRATTPGEQHLLRLPWPDGWLVVSGIEIADHSRTREVDLLVIAPQGLLTVEQKDTSASGVLRFTLNDAPVVNGRPLPQLAGAVRQARLPAQMLGASLKEAGIRGGFVRAALALHGNVRIEPDQVGGVRLCRTRDLVATAEGLLGAVDEEEALQVGTVLGVLSHLGLPLHGLPALQEIGFPESAW